jgi:tetratricopeptide (TPR) repeat protein
MRRMRALALILVAPAVWARPAALAAQAPSDTLLVLLERATQVQQEGRFPEARSMLSGRLDHCAASVDGSRCRQMLYYGLGYIAQLQADAAGDPVDLLRQARAAYVASLSASRGGVHRPTLENLALVYGRLGPGNVVRSEIDDMLWLDPARAAQYRTLLGDHYRLAGKPDSASLHYMLALQEANAEPLALATLTGLALQGDSTAVRLLERLLPSVEEHFLEHSADAYRALITTRFAGDSAAAAEALARWVDLRARNGSFSEDRLGELPPEWHGDMVDALRAFVESPGRVPTPQSGWMSSPGRRSSFARAALALGARKLEAGAPEEAEQYWRSGWEIAVPASPVALDLTRELAALYVQRPRQDPGSAKLEALETALFSWGEDAMGTEDLAARQRFHSTLGMIYADRGQWESGAARSRGAVYHLERALATAAQREGRERFHQPLPALRARLAEGYAATGDTARITAAYVDGVRAHLDTDDVEGARTLLGRLVPRDSAASALLQRVVETRAESEGPRCDTPRAAAFTSGAGLPDAASTAEAEFLVRQRFKVAADCALTSTDTLQARFAATALALALWERPGGAKLALGDLSRLDRTKDLVRERFGLGPRGVLVYVWQPRDSASSVPTVSLHDQPRYLVLDRGSALAARLGSVLPAGIDGTQVRIERRGILLIGDAADPRIRELADTLRALEEVREVRIESP